MQPDGMTLRLALQSTQREKPSSVLELVSLEILIPWNGPDNEDKVWLAEEVMAATTSICGETSKTVTKPFGPISRR
jgi:hypothetical protein